MTTDMHIISLSVEPEFDAVVSIADRIARKYGTSRSVIMRTVLHEYFGVPIKNPESHDLYMTAIEMELSKMQNQQEVKC